MLALIGLGVASPTVFAAEDNSGGNVPNELIILRPRIPSGRPNAPSLITIECWYHDGILTLASNYYKGGFSLCFENYETGVIYEIPSIRIGESAPIALEIGEYQLTAVAEDGTELIGFMQVY